MGMWQGTFQPLPSLVDTVQGITFGFCVGTSGTCVAGQAGGVDDALGTSQVRLFQRVP